MSFSRSGDDSRPQTLAPNRRGFMLCASALIAEPAFSQTPAPDEDVAIARARCQRIVDRYYARLHALGVEDRGSPSILIAYTPARTSYDPNLRQITAPAWSQCPATLHAQLQWWAQISHAPFDAQTLFAEIYQGFMIAHEATHAYQADLGFWNPQADLFESEIIANRGAIAFALETPDGAAHVAELMNLATTAFTSAPSPLPPGADLRTFFNANAASIQDDPAQHGWFEANMMAIAWSRRNELNFQTLILNLKKASVL